MSTDLIPLSVVAERLGVKPKTLRNRAARARAGLAGWSLPITKLGERCYVRAEDLELFLDGLKNQHTDDGPRAELHRIAGTVCKLFPSEAKRLREIAAVIPHPAPQRKRKPRAALRRVGAPLADTRQPEVQE